MMHFLVKLKEKYKQYGIIKTIYLALKKMLSFLIEVRKELLLSIEPGDELNVKLKPKIPLCFEIAKEHDLKQLHSIVNKSKRDLFINRVNEDKICVIAIFQKEIVAYGWITTQDEYEPNSGVNIKVGENESYIFDCHTISKYRGKGAYKALLNEMLNISEELLNKSRVLIAVRKNNLPAYHAIKNAGFNERILYTTYIIMGRKRVFPKILN